MIFETKLLIFIIYTQTTDFKVTKIVSKTLKRSEFQNKSVEFSSVLNNK